MSGGEGDVSQFVLVRHTEHCLKVVGKKRRPGKDQNFRQHSRPPGVENLGDARLRRKDHLKKEKGWPFFKVRGDTHVEITGEQAQFLADS